MPEVNDVYKTRLNWVIFFWPVILLCVATYVGISFEVAHTPSLIMAAIGAVWFIITWFTYQFSSITIKRKQIIVRTGFLVRQTVDIPLSKVESVDIRQSLIGSMFQYGSLVITGTGGSKQSVNFLNKPLTCRRYIEQLMHA